jgi:hypothetical protein
MVECKRKQPNLPKLNKQKCYVCGHSNLYLMNEFFINCANCARKIYRGKNKNTTIGIDGSFVNQEVYMYYEEKDI